MRSNARADVQVNFKKIFSGVQGSRVLVDEGVAHGWGRRQALVTEAGAAPVKKPGYILL